MIGNTARVLAFLLISSTDHLTGLTGVTPVVKISKNGAAGIPPSGAITAVDATNLPGWYQVAANATDANTRGPLLLHATATGADPCDEEFQVVNYNPDANLASDVQTVVTVPVATPTAGSNIYFNELFTTLPGIYISGVTSDSSANGYYSFSGASANGLPVYTGSNYKLWVNGSYQWQLSLITIIGPNPKFISPGLATSLPYGLSLSVLSGGAIGTAVISQPAANATQISTSAGAAIAASVLADTNNADWATPGTPGYQLMNGGTGGSTNASVFTGAFPSSVLANAPTGPIYNVSNITPIGALTPFPLTVQQYMAINLPIPVATSMLGKTLTFAVCSQTNRTTALWTITGANCTVSSSGLVVTVTGPNTNTQTAPPNGWYWYLIDETDSARVGEGPLLFDPGPNA
jgi:hypothetical protein